MEPVACCFTGTGAVSDPFDARSLRQSKTGQAKKTGKKKIGLACLVPGHGGRIWGRKEPLGYCFFKVYGFFYEDFHQDKEGGGN